MLIKIESKLRGILYWFCAYSFLSALYKVVLHTPSIPILIFMFLIPFSFAVGYVVRKEIEEYFKMDWDWTPTSWIERLQNEFILFVGVASLYFMTQLGLMILLFPGFESVNWFGLKAYQLIFSLNCVLAYSFYRHIIIPKNSGDIRQS